MKRPNIIEIEAYVEAMEEYEDESADTSRDIIYYQSLIAYIKYLERNAGIVNLGTGNNQKGATITIGNISGGGRR